MAVFVAVLFKRMWEIKNAIIHDGFGLDARQIERLCWKTDLDVREEETRVGIKLIERQTWSRTSVNGFYISFLGPNQSS